MRQTIKIKIYLVKSNNLKFICCLHKSLFLGKLLKNFADFPIGLLINYFAQNAPPRGLCLHV